MFDKSFASHTLGLELDRFSLKGAALSCTRRSIKLENAFEFPLERSQEPDQNVKPLYKETEELKRIIGNALTVTAIPAQDVLIRPLSLKVKKEKDIDAILAFQAEPLLPYPVENAVLDRMLLSKDAEGTELALFAVRKDHLEKELKHWTDQEIKPGDRDRCPSRASPLCKNVRPLSHTLFRALPWICTSLLHPDGSRPIDRRPNSSGQDGPASCSLSARGAAFA